MVKERPPTHRICPLSLTSPAGRGAEAWERGSAEPCFLLARASAAPPPQCPRSHPPRGSQPAPTPLWGSWALQSVCSLPLPNPSLSLVPGNASPYLKSRAPLMSPVPRFHAPLPRQICSPPPFLLSNSVPSLQLPVLTHVLHLLPITARPGLECAGSLLRPVPAPPVLSFPYSQYPPSPRLCPAHPLMPSSKPRSPGPQPLLPDPGDQPTRNLLLPYFSD